ncbi:MAG: hypothetical protein NC489_27505 [Ruminococcus flavefaciens]|nr:hypothetical protein [Ruminococcus flavefaciens]
MKIKITENSKKVITLADKLIIDEIRENCAEIEIKDYILIALALAGAECPFNVKIYEVTAEIAKNYRIWNYYGDIDEGVNTEDFDVWVEFSVLVPLEGFYVIGVYLSDLWSFIPRGNNDEIRKNMYIQKYTYIDK